MNYRQKTNKNLHISTISTVVSIKFCLTNWLSKNKKRLSRKITTCSRVCWSNILMVSPWMTMSWEIIILFWLLTIRSIFLNLLWRNKKIKLLLRVDLLSKIHNCNYREEDNLANLVDSEEIQIWLILVPKKLKLSSKNNYSNNDV